MTTFDKREDAFESQFVHDQDLRFKAEARRDKLLGLWAAEKLGRAGVDAEAYAQSIIALAVRERGGDAIFRKIRADFDAVNVSISDHRIRRTMEELLERAAAEIKAGV